MKIGFLTEKNSAKENFAKAFGGTKGTYKGNSFVISNLVGHVYEFLEPHEMVNPELSKKYKSWDITNLPWNLNDFNWKQKITKGKKDVVMNLVKTFKDCDEIIIATDIDPSGEGFLLAAEFLLNTNIYNGKRITRMEFVDESPKSLQKAFETRKEVKNITENVEYKKAIFRSKWDYLSMQLTRASTNYAPGKMVLRNGRVKSLMNTLVANALNDLENYKEIPYYENRFKDENGIIYINKKEIKYPNKNDVPLNYEPSTVILESKINKKSIPPKLIDLLGLSGKLAPMGISPATVKNTYQKLYEDGIVSYPRTDDNNITYEQFNEMLPLIDKIANLVSVDTKLLTNRSPRITHVQNKGSHGANRPGLNVPDSLESLTKYGRGAKKIYETLALSFLAMFCEDYIYEHQSGYLEKYPDYKGSANIPLNLGWKAIYSSEDDNLETSNKGLGKLAKPFIYEGFPPKPPQPTVKWLSNKLKKYNVGTGATRNSTLAEITSKTSKTALLTETRGKLGLTDNGYYNAQIINSTNISSHELTELIHLTMKEIESGNDDVAIKVLNDLVNVVNEDIKIMSENKKNIKYITYEKKEKETITTENGEEVSFNKTWGSYTFTNEEIKKLANGETIEIKGLKGKKNKTYGVRGKLEWQTYKNKKFYGFKVLEFIND